MTDFLQVLDLRSKISSSIPSTAITPKKISRRLMALTGLLQLINKYAQFDIVQSAVASSNLQPKLIDILQALLSVDRDVEYHDLELTVSILEDCTEVSDARLPSKQDEDEKIIDVTTKLMNLLPKVRSTPNETIMVSILKYTILVTNSGSPVICRSLCTDETIVCAEQCIERVVNANEEEEYGLSANIAIFSIGLLVNFCENEEARNEIAKTKYMKEIVRLFKIAVSSSSHAEPARKTYMTDIRGYLALLLGLLTRERLVIEGGAVLVAAVGKELEVFRDDACGEGSQDDQDTGIVGQISNVLKKLYAEQ